MSDYDIVGECHLIFNQESLRLKVEEALDMGLSPEDISSVSSADTSDEPF